MSNIPNKNLLDDTFILDKEFMKYISLASLEMDTGGLLIAPIEKFDEIFIRETLDLEKSIIKISTQGRIVEEKIRSRK